MTRHLLIAPVLIALGAGFVSAVLLGTVAVGTVPGALLFWLAPMPIIIVGLGWHWLVAALAALAAGLILTLTLHSTISLSYMALAGVPAICLSWLAVRGRPAGDLVFFVALYAATVVLFGSLRVDVSLEGLRERIAGAAETLLRAQLDIAPGKPMILPGGQDLSALPSFYALILPSAMAAIVTLSLVLCLWLAAWSVRKSGRLPVAWAPLYDTQAPRGASAFWLLALVVSFMGGYVGYAGGLIVTSFSFAFMLIGFAVAHRLTLGAPGRSLILSALWAAVLLIGLPGLVLIVLGLADHVFDFRRLRRNPNPTS
jgi:Predicted membrane protein (DUF2232)